MYGEFDFQETKGTGEINPKTKKQMTEQIQFGETVGLGYTLGEEVLFKDEYN